MSREEDIAQVRQLLLNVRGGALGTLSASQAGHPFVSSVDCLGESSGRILILISALAEHTRNIMTDPRVSLLLQDSHAERQAAPRLTLTGVAEPVPTEAMDREIQRYLEAFPESAPWLTLDFTLYQIIPHKLRYVGGFGVARWLSPGDLGIIRV